MGSEEEEEEGGECSEGEGGDDWKQGRQVASAACTLSDHEKWMACISLYLFLFLFKKKEKVCSIFFGGDACSSSLLVGFDCEGTMWVLQYEMLKRGSDDDDVPCTNSSAN